MDNSSWWFNKFSFNNKYQWSREEKCFLTQQLYFLAPMLKDGLRVIMMKPLHCSKGDLVPHYTFVLCNSLTDIRSAKDLFAENRKKQFHMYVYQGRMIRLVTFINDIPSVVDFPM